MALNLGADPEREARLVSVIPTLVAAQRFRRTWLADLPQSLAKEDPRTLQLAIRDIEKYRDGIARDLRTLKGRNISVKLLDVLKEEIQYSEDKILYIQDSLRGDRSNVEHRVQQIVDRITTRTQVQLRLRQACEQMKRESPEELHADIDRAFRRAIDELRER